MNVGELVPDFTLLTTEGESVCLYQELQIAPVVLFFYLRAFTPLCTKEACDFQSRLPQFDELGAQVFGISSDSERVARQFKKTFGLQFPLLLDSDGTVRKLFGVPRVWGIVPGRATYVIGQDRRVTGVTHANGGSRIHVEESLQFLDQS
jgi:thioredoxin-dependent peroxiredoxin